MDRDLGQLGESTLATWAAARGISAQRVTIDRHGWDYLLEFKLPGTSGSAALPLDTVPAPIACLIQVKSTSTGNLNRSVELVNWLRLIKSPLPAFFLVLDFALADAPSTAYLVPLDRDNISQALRRVRQLDSESADLAEHTLSVNCREEHKLEVPNGASLEIAIRSHIGPSLEEYIQQKREWVSTVGYESGRGTFRFDVSDESLNSRSLPEVMVDLFLGLREPLTIDYAELRDVRFGIPAKEPYRELSSGTIEIIVEPVETVEVILQTGVSVVRTRMDMFLPRGMPDEIIEKGLLKIRLTSKLFEFVDCGSKMDISIRLPEADSRVRLSDLRDLASVILLFHKSAISCEGVRITVQSSKGTVLRKTTTPCAGFKAEMIEFAALLQSACMIARYLEIEDRAEPTIEELAHQEQRLTALRMLLSGETFRMKHRAFYEPGFPHNGQRACALTPISLVLGDYMCTVMVSLWGDVYATGRTSEGRYEYEITTGEIKAEGTFATSREEDHSAILRGAIKAFVEAHNDMPCLIPSEDA